MKNALGNSLNALTKGYLICRQKTKAYFKKFFLEISFIHVFLYFMLSVCAYTCMQL